MALRGEYTGNALVVRVGSVSAWCMRGMSQHLTRTGRDELVVVASRSVSVTVMRGSHSARLMGMTRRYLRGVTAATELHGRDSRPALV